MQIYSLREILFACELHLSVGEACDPSCRNFCLSFERLLRPGELYGTSVGDLLMPLLLLRLSVRCC